MKKLRRAAGLIALLLVWATLLSTPVYAVNFEDFSDAQGHWAEAYLRRAVEEGLLSGVSAGSLSPDTVTDLPQAVTILCRVLEPTGEADVPELGDEWYAPYVRRAMTMGVDFDTELLTRGQFTRADAFTLIAGAFRLIPADPDYSVLRDFSDAQDLTPAQRDAAAALVSAGFLNGSDGRLYPMRTVTRAEFVTMLLRVFDCVVSGNTVPAELKGGAVLRKTGDIAGRTFTSTVWISFGAEKADLSGVKAGTVVVLTSKADVVIDGSTSIDRLVLAGSSSGTLTVSRGNIGTLVIAPGGPTQVTVRAGVKNVEVTGDKVDLTVMGDIEKAAFSGSGITARLRGNVAKLSIGENSSGNTVNTYKKVEQLLVYGSCSTVTAEGGVLQGTLGGSGCTLSGSGSVSDLKVVTRLSKCTLSGTIREEFPQGAGDVTLALTAPKFLSVGADIDASVTVTSPEERDVELTWSLGNEVLKTQTVKAGPEARKVSLSSPVTYFDGIEPTLPLRVTAAQAGGQPQVSAFAPVMIEGAKNVFKGASIKIFNAAPEDSVNLNITATVSGGARVSATLVWYEGGVPMRTESVTLGDSLTITYACEPHYIDGDGYCRVAAKLSFSSGGTSAELAGSVGVRVGVSPQEALDTVTSKYEGDYTLEYALKHDYSDLIKTAWVNAKGYSSDTEYLIWVNRTYQRVNVFRGSAGSWKLEHVFLCGTGAPGSGTPVGEYTVWGFQKGWYHSYWVEPVVRFKTGSGYAFHSRLWNPGHETLQDSRIGFPISAGCVRMYDEDVQWLYDNIPLYTKVVVH